MSAVCGICPRACSIGEGELGFCRARANRGGSIVCARYGGLSSVALDPIEKKPLRRFEPGSMILSAGGFGCNMRCGFCQNSGISAEFDSGGEGPLILPERLADMAEAARAQGNIGIAYTYNEPLVMYEYVYDCARLMHERGLKNVLVTNGYINKAPLLELLPHIDAMNIDLKGFTQEFYAGLGGSLEVVMDTIETAARHCHVEVTTLIIPGENDGADEMERLSAWLARVDDGIPLHISRFFPRYLYADRQPTPVGDIYALADAARRRLRHVYTGNC